MKFACEGAHYYTSKKRDSKLSSNKFGLRNNLLKSILDEKASHNGEFEGPEEEIPLVTWIFWAALSAQRISKVNKDTTD